jgi:O-antigen ligase/polysaccharide polymerase Wzy-like membrane protein
VEPNKADIRFPVAASGAALLSVSLVAIAVNGGTYALIPRCEAFVLIWWILTLSLTLGILPRARLTLPVTIAALGLLGLVAWTAASLLWTESDERTVIELTRVTGFAGVVLVVGWFVTAREWEVVSAGVALAGVAVCVLALTSRLAPALLHSPLSSAGLPRRLSFPLNYWNAIGCWAAMTVGLTLAWSAHAGRWPVRGAALAGVCVAASVAYLTYSRSAAAGVVIAVATVVALSRHRWLAAAHAVLATTGTALIVLTVRGEPAIARGTGGAGGATVALVVGLVIAGCALAALATARAGLERLRTPPRRARDVLVAATLTTLFAAVAVGPALANRAWRSFERPTPALAGDPAQRLTTLGGTRRALWNAALEAFERHPLNGTGPGTFEFVWNRDPQRSYFVRDAHSLYLESLGELGLPGALLVVASLGSLLFGALRTTLRETDAGPRGAAVGAAAALTVFCVFAGVDWMWESTAVTVMALAAGVLVANAGAGPANRLSLQRRAPAVLLAALALAVQMPVLGAAIQVRASQREVRARDFDDAASSATTAIQIAPWAASGYIQRALLLERLGVAARAAADARRATQREPTNWNHWLILARIEAERGRVRAAVADVRRAAALNPHEPLFRSQRRSRR